MTQELPLPDISVLGLVEDGSFCAIALELSLRGYGANFEEAVGNLKEAIIAQIQFAIEKHGSLDGIFVRAESRYWKMYREGQRIGLAMEDLGALPTTRIGTIPGVKSSQLQAAGLS